MIKRIICLLLILLTSWSTYAQNDNIDHLATLSSRIKAAKSYDFSYKSGDAAGDVSIAHNEMYLSQEGKLEIYEKEGVRYTHNIKRKKVDIDAISKKENGGAIIFNWINHLDHYTLTSKELDKKGNIIYKISDGEDEKIKVAFSTKGILSYIIYESSTIKQMVIEIHNFNLDKKTPSDFFTFDPTSRTDLEVTDYR